MDYKKTKLAIILGFLLIYVIFRLNLLLYFTLFLTVIFLSLPFVGNKICHMWLKFAYIVGKINTKIILTIIFYFILTPIAILYRLKEKDFLRIKKTDASQFYHREYKYCPEDFEKLW